MTKLKQWQELARSLKAKDRDLAPLIKAIGMPTLEFQADAFKVLTQSILSQQLATAAARTIIGRFSKLQSPYPTPKTLREIPIEKLRSVGVSGQKAGYLLSLATFWQDRKWRANWDTLPDEELIARLTQVKGIGEWTAHMFLIFSLGRTNILPVGDYGVRKGLQKLKSLKELPEPKEMRVLLRHWEGAYSVGSWYLWQAQDRKLLS